MTPISRKWPKSEQPFSPAAALPPPKVMRHGRFRVLRDDLIVGGTKTRALLAVLERAGHGHVAYACDLFGYGPIALAEATRILGIRATLIFPQLTVTSPSYLAVCDLPHVRAIVRSDLASQNLVFEAAKEIAQAEGASLFPLGFDTPQFVEALAEIATGLGISPQEVWSLAGSGCLTRALQRAWPTATIHAVSMGFAHAKLGNAVVHVAPEATGEPASIRPPYPSSPYYDAKLWRFVEAEGAQDAFIWNVA